MSDSDKMTAEEIAGQRDAFIERFLGYAAGTFSLFSIYIGERLGYYRALAGGSLTSTELASRTNTHERYAREWLEQQTVAGILEVEDESLDASKRRFRLPSGHAEPLIEQDSLNYIAPLTRLMAGAVRPIDSLLEAYRTGGSVPFSEYGSDLREGQAAINRPAFFISTRAGMVACYDRCSPTFTVRSARALPISDVDMDGPASASRRDIPTSMWMALTSMNLPSN
ncbi:MAG: hypothetical protein L0287_12495 [Anaerolineae bacterium]|nr:hypothetical protein [Anaerolineae bacterium]